MQLTDFQWEEREGLLPDETPFHEWIFMHGSGRILAVVRGPQDRRGGFSHDAGFMFRQEITMRGGPFVFIDFDSAKRFVEATVERTVESIDAEGVLSVAEPPNEMANAMKEAMQTGMSAFLPRLPAV